MKNELETIGPNLREINSYEDNKAEAIERGFVIVTLRQPKASYDFVPGERVLINCQKDGRKVPVVVISNTTKILKSYEVPVLALDEALNPEQAVEMLSPFYKDTTLDSPMQSISFLYAEKFDALPKDLQKKLTNPENTLVSLAKEKELREIFFPTMCFWVSKFGGDITDWTAFLKTNELITEEERLLAGQYWASYFERKNDEQKMEAYQATTAGFLHSISVDPKNELFKPFVLCLPKN